MRSAVLSSLLFAFATIVGCAATQTTGGFTEATGAGGSTGTGTNTDSSGLGGSFANGSGSTTGSGGGCSAAAELVYVLSTSNEIYSFDPGKKQFVDLFTLNCQPKDPDPSNPLDWQPNSMAVDRNAVAWVNYVGTDPFALQDAAGQIFKVDLVQKSCEPAPAVKLPTNWFRLGMGFSTDAADSTSETLYVTGTGDLGTSPGLGKIDVNSKSLVTAPGPWKGDATLSGQNAELTGTGDAKLFGFFTTSPSVRVAEIDKGTANILSNKQITGVAPPQAWAFSFWGGAFYLYTSDGTTPSNVTRYDPMTSSIDTSFIPDVGGFVIVGAGVSTCAPLTPPK
jgi:hypothetical protein